MEETMTLISKRGIVKILKALRNKRHLNARMLNNFIIFVIIVNSLSLGFETSHYFYDRYGAVLTLIDNIALCIFTIEIGVKLLLNRLRFFHDPWNVFDFLIVGASLLTFIPQLNVLRTLRILRIFLIISFMPRLRFLVESLLLSLPGILGISILLGVVFYVFAIIATQLFGADNYYTFGDLGKSLYSLFRITTLDGAWTIINKVLKNHSYAYFFFIPFILFSSYIILNIFIAIIINSMREARLKSEALAKKKEHLDEMEENDRRNEILVETLMKKLNQIDERIARMEAAQESLKETVSKADNESSPLHEAKAKK